MIYTYLNTINRNHQFLVYPLLVDIKETFMETTSNRIESDQMIWALLTRNHWYEKKSEIIGQKKGTYLSPR